MTWRSWATGCALATVAACATPSPMGSDQRSLTGPTHSAVNSCADLVIIRAQTTAEGIAEEEAWLARRYPGSTKIGEQVTDCDGKPVDRVTIAHDGGTRTVLFDISSYFGKVGEDDLDDLLDG